MSATLLTSLLHWSSTTALLLAFGFVLSRLVVRLVARAALPFSWSTVATLQRALLVAAMVGPTLALLLPAHDLFPATSELWRPWATEAWRTTTGAAVATTPAVVVGATPANPPLPLMSWSAAVTMALLGMALLGTWSRLACTTRDALRLRRLLRACTLLRGQGALRILVSPDTTIPFSVRGWRTSCVVLPESLLDDAATLRTAIRHEGIHLRRRDPVWMLAVEAVTILFPWHPLVRAWARLLGETQEYACDEGVVGRDAHSAHAYGTCLVRVGERVSFGRSMFAGTATMTGVLGDPRHSKLLLERRLAMLSRHAAAPRDRRLAVALGTTAVLVTALFAYAANGRDDGPLPPVGLDKIQALVAEENAAKPAIPLVANQLVLDRINGYRSRPGQAAALRAAMERGESYKPQIEPRLKSAKLPTELLAIPFVESRFQNIKQKDSGALGVISGAGLWMFIKPTARRYGLIVNKEVDERLDVERETGAAIRYLSDLHDEFRDWQLALAAYNEGEGAVRLAIAKGGTRDAWKLLHDGHLNDYLVYVTAGILIMKHPELMD